MPKVGLEAISRNTSEYSVFLYTFQGEILLGSSQVNCWLDDATLVPTMRKPSDVFAEGLLSETSGEGGMAIELFIAGVQSWDTGLRRVLAASADEK
jgi:hypothetical protein